jgi:hypothetical protein
VLANVGKATEAEAVRVEAAKIMLADHDGDMVKGPTLGLEGGG